MELSSRVVIVCRRLRVNGSVGAVYCIVLSSVTFFSDFIKLQNCIFVTPSDYM